MRSRITLITSRTWIRAWNPHYQIQRTDHPCGHLLDNDSHGLEAATMADLTGAMTERLIPTELAATTP
jgi:hypothetical protein